MIMTLRAAAAGAALCVALAATGRGFEATIVLFAAIISGGLLDFVAKTERRRPGRAGGSAFRL